jgi:cyclic pyranopterin phosphate synthase
MSKKKFTHIDSSGNPAMVDVSGKKITKRTAKAQATVHVGDEILSQIKGNELITKKGPVFQTAIIAGVMGAKNTSYLIPFCHPLGLEDCQVKIQVKKKRIVIDTSATITSRTGVEMEALTAVSVACLTIYDMVKAVERGMRIEGIRLVEKRGGKSGHYRAKE